MTCQRPKRVREHDASRRVQYAHVPDSWSCSLLDSILVDSLASMPATYASPIPGTKIDPGSHLCSGHFFHPYGNESHWIWQRTSPARSKEPSSLEIHPGCPTILAPFAAQPHRMPHACFVPLR